MLYANGKFISKWWRYISRFCNHFAIALPIICRCMSIPKCTGHCRLDQWCRKEWVENLWKQFTIKLFHRKWRWISNLWLCIVHCAFVDTLHFTKTNVIDLTLISFSLFSTIRCTVNSTAHRIVQCSSIRLIWIWFRNTISLYLGPSVPCAVCITFMSNMQAKRLIGVNCGDALPSFTCRLIAKETHEIQFRSVIIN